MTSSLPSDIDASYLDQSPGDAAHQQHHDVLHALNNVVADAPDDSLFVKENGVLVPVGRDTWVARSDVLSDSINADESTTSSTYTDLVTVGPSVTVDVGSSGKVLAIWAASSYLDTTNFAVFASIAATGANTVAADDNHAIEWFHETATRGQSGTFVRLLSGLASGSTTFTVKYRTGGGEASFRRRRLVVVPL